MTAQLDGQHLMSGDLRARGSTRVSGELWWPHPQPRMSFQTSMAKSILLSQHATWTARLLAFTSYTSKSGMLGPAADMQMPAEHAACATSACAESTTWNGKEELTLLEHRLNARACRASRRLHLEPAPVLPRVRTQDPERSALDEGCPASVPYTSPDICGKVCLLTANTAYSAADPHHCSGSYPQAWEPRRHLAQPHSMGVQEVAKAQGSC